jgi:DNA polymerase (family 10)
MGPEPGGLDRLAVVRALQEMAGLLRLVGESSFRARAYERAARTLERADVDLAGLVKAGRLADLPGIGSRLAAVISELHLSGHSRVLDALRGQLPAGAGELSRVPALGLGTIAALSGAGIQTVDQLRAACETGRARGLTGIGEKTERRILDSIRRLESRAVPEMLLPEAIDLGEALRVHVAAGPGVQALDLAGGLRRWTETVDQLVVVAAALRPAAALDHALAAPVVAAVGRRGRADAEARLVNGLPLEMRVVPRRSYAVELLRATGAATHVAQLFEQAMAQGIAVRPSGLWRDGRSLPAETEADVYRHLGLPYIPPELREGQGEIEAARAGTLPDDLLAAEDVRGFVHCHTVYSDGRHTIEEMARAADGLGMEYLTITDHSPTASYAGGLTVDRLRTQWDEIARVQESVSVRLLRGTESDILASGALDYPDAVLEQLDIVIASVHARYRMDADRMTERLRRAMSLPCFKVWGHALGRLLLSRPPIECRVEEVLDTVQSARAAVEINGDPRRLDLAPRWIPAARARGIPFVVSTDAHSVGELANLRYGVAMARRGGVRRGEVLNTLGATAFARAVAPAGRG